MEFEGAFFDTTNLGEGQFGKVYVVRNQIDAKEYAAKIIKTNGVFNGHQQMLLMREALILLKLNHPSIVKFYGINFHSFDDPNQLEPTIVTEYLTHGSLKKILDAEKLSMAIDGWTSTKKFISLLGIAHAMKYMHHHGVIHRDLKPENILIDDDFYPRICDFGLSRCFTEILTNSIQLKMTNKIGTPLYMAPELFSDDQDNQYGPGVDVYAFAMLAYEIVTGKVPFEENGKRLTLSGLIKKVLTGERPIFNEFATDKMKDLICQCWNDDPKERPSFDEIYQRLSEDFTFFDEDVDEDEVNNYIDILNDSNDQQNDEREVEMKNLKNENESLKQRIIQLEEENKNNSQFKDIMSYVITKYDSLVNVIEDPEFFDEFLNFCQKEKCMEYALFYRDALIYKHITDPNNRRQKFIEMNYNYVKKDAPLRISFISGSLDDVDGNKPPIDAFNEILFQVDIFLEKKVFNLFKRSSSYNSVIKKKANDPKILLDHIKKLQEENKRLVNDIIQTKHVNVSFTNLMTKCSKLEDVLENPVFFDMFESFCQLKMYDEYLLFYKDAIIYKQITNQAERRQKFIEMIDNYVKDDSRFHVNVQSSILKKLENTNEKDPPPDVFDEMLLKVKIIMKVEIFPMFKRSVLFNKFFEKRMTEKSLKLLI